MKDKRLEIKKYLTDINKGCGYIKHDNIMIDITVQLQATVITV